MKFKVIFLAIILFCTACQDSSNSAKQTQGVEATNKTVNPPASLTKLFAPNDKVFRGFDFQATKNKISQQETVSPRNKQKTSKKLAYTIELTDDTFADIDYYFNSNRLHKIEVNLFAKDKRQAKGFHKDLTDFFNKKYKTRTSLWEGKEGNAAYTIFMKPILTTQSNGVYLVWEVI